MDNIKLDIHSFVKHFGIKSGNDAIIFLRTHFRIFKHDEELLIKSIAKTIAHEELHIIFRRFNVRYTTNEEKVLKRMQQYLYPELYEWRII